MVIYLPLFIALVGLVVYALSTAPKPAEIGRMMFWVGLLAFLLVATPHLITVLK